MTIRDTDKDTPLVYPKVRNRKLNTNKRLTRGLRRISDKIRRRTPSEELDPINENTSQNELGNYRDLNSSSGSLLSTKESILLKRHSSDKENDITSVGLGLAGNGLQRQTSFDTLNKRNSVMIGGILRDPTKGKNIGHRRSFLTLDNKSKTPTTLIRCIMSHNMGLKDYRSLEKILRNQEKNKDWIHQFLAFQGHMTLGVRLQGISRRTIKSNEQLDEEFTIINSLRDVMNFQEKQEGAVHLSTIDRYIVPSLLSPRTITRNAATSMLALSVAYEPQNAAKSIMQGLVDTVEDSEINTGDSYSDISSNDNPFSVWIPSALELVTIFQSENSNLVYSSEDFSKGRLTPQAMIKEYVLLTIFLISSFVSTYEDLKDRLNIRKQLNSANLSKFLNCAKSLNSDAINDLIQNYNSFRDEDIAKADVGLDDASLSPFESPTLGTIPQNSTQRMQKSYSPYITGIMQTISKLCHSKKEGMCLKYLRVLDSLTKNLIYVDRIDDKNILFSTQLLLDRLNTDENTIRQSQTTDKLVSEYRDRIHSLEGELASVKKELTIRSAESPELGRNISSKYKDSSESDVQPAVIPIGDKNLSNNFSSTDNFYEPFEHYDVHASHPNQRTVVSTGTSTDDFGSSKQMKEFKTDATSMDEEIPPAMNSPAAPPLPSFLSKVGSIPSSHSGTPKAPPIPAFLSTKTTESFSAPVTPVIPPPAPAVPECLTRTVSAASSEQGPRPPSAPPLPDGFLNSSSASINKIHTAQKMKHIHWDKIIDTSNTFWNTVDDDEITSTLNEAGVMKQVERSFKALDTPAKSTLLRKQKNAEKKTTLLPQELQQQFGINLHQYSNLTPKQFVNKVLRCNHELLGNTTLIEFFNWNGLLNLNSSVTRKFEPYSTDAKDKADATKLARFDWIYLELCYNLRSYWTERSQALILAATYERDYRDLLRRLNQIDRAIGSIKNSQALLKVLAVIKSIGNHMNDPTKTVKGFKLSALQRLKFLKSTQDNTTLLHFIEEIIRTNFSDLAVFVDDLKELSKISGVSISTLQSEVMKYKKGVRACNYQFIRGKLSDPSKLHPRDQIRDYMKVPLSNSAKHAEFLGTHMSRTFKDFDDLMIYFGEDPKDKPSRESFFGKIYSFAESYKKVHTENVRAEEEAKALEIRKKMIEDFKNKRSKMVASRSASEGSAGTNAIEGLLTQLRSNKPLTRKYSQYQEHSKRETLPPENIMNKAQEMLNNLKNDKEDDEHEEGDTTNDSRTSLNDSLNDNEEEGEDTVIQTPSLDKKNNRLSIITMLINGPDDEELNALSGEEEGDTSIEEIIEGESDDDDADSYIDMSQKLEPDISTNEPELDIKRVATETVDDNISTEQETKRNSAVENNNNKADDAKISSLDQAIDQAINEISKNISRRKNTKKKSALPN